MSNQPMGGYVGSGHDVNRASASLKARSEMFARSNAQKKAITEETAQYRLKGTNEKFAASSSTSADTALQQATVGLVTKEEFARRREALEAEQCGVSGDAAAAAPTEQDVRPKSKKKKKAQKTGGLSFALEDEDADNDDAVAPPSEKKRKSSE
jgi:hypothetical protein